MPRTYTWATRTSQEKSEVFPSSSDSVLLANRNAELSITDLLGELFLTDASDDLAKTLRLKGKRVAGTCEWLLSKAEYSSWAAGDGFQLLWLTGDPGTGKTVISCFLVEKLQELVHVSPSAVFAHYFCDNKDEQRRTATAILRGILVQLLKKQPELFDLVKEDYKIKKGSIAANLDALWGVLVKILRSQSEPVHILIDALDECEVSSRGELLALLADLDPSIKARILITSRLESDIEETERAVGRGLRLDSAKINSDLTKFIDVRVDELREKKRYPVKLVEDIRNAVRDQAGGTFLWVSLVLKDIAATKTARTARKKLESMPSDLPGVYQRILDNISEDDMHDAAFILQWVVVSRRPMTIIELATVAALGGDEGWDENTVPPAEVLDELKDAFRSCGPLLYHDPDDDTINLIHQSAKDYLVAMDPRSLYHVNREEASMQIIKTCWKYLTMQEFAQGAVIISCSETKKLVPIQLSKRILGAYGFLGYATEELRDGEIAEKLALITAFVRQSENLDELGVLRDYWLIASVTSGHIEGVQALLDKHADTAIRPAGHWSWPVLHLAAIEGHDAIVRLLVTKGSDATDMWDQQTALHRAAMNGHTEACRILIDNGAQIEAKGDFKGKTALHWAAQEGHKAATALLLEKGANMNSEDSAGNNPLFMALQGGSEDVALLLWDLGADFNLGGPSEQDLYERRFSDQPGDVMSFVDFDELRTNDGASDGIITPGDYERETALFPAAATGCYRVAKRLVENGVDINARNLSHRTALSGAAANGHVEVARLLIDAGADVGWRDRKTKKTFIHLATERGHVEMLKLLVDKGVELDGIATYRRQRRRDGLDYLYGDLKRSALHVAIMLGNRAAVEVLVEAGASLVVRSDKGKTALHLAAEFGHGPVLGYLLDRGGDLAVRDKMERTALHIAARRGHDAIVDLLVVRGASVEERDKNGWTPLHYAAYGEQTTTVLLLTRIRGVGINTAAKWGHTALHTVVQCAIADDKGEPEVIWESNDDDKRGRLQRVAEMTTLLLKEGADIEATDFRGQTALHLAAYEASWTIAKLLLDHGANINVVDSKGMTPLHMVVGDYSAYFTLAMGFGDVKKAASISISELLLDRGADAGVIDSLGRTVLFGAAATENCKLACSLLRLGADACTIDGAERTSYPKVNRLRESVEKWRLYNFNDSEAESESSHGLIQSTVDEMLHLLFEMAAYTLASEKPSVEWLSTAAKKGYAAVVSMLVRREDAEDMIMAEGKSSALTAAASKGHKEVVRVLLESGVDVDARHFSSTALHEAARHGHEPVVRLLLERGADVHARDSGDWSPLMTAAASGHHRIIEVLLDWGADVSDRHSWATGLSQAASNGYVDAVRVLLDRGADIDAATSSGGSAPLHRAVSQQRDAVVELLLNRGANVNVKENDGCTPISIALGMPYTETIVPLLLQHGADPKTVSKQGETLASWAMRNSPTDVLRLLALEQECLELGGRDWQALLTWAIEKGHDDVVSCLLEKGMKVDVQASEMLYNNMHDPLSFLDFDL